MPEVESVDDHYKQNINEYYRITVKHSGRVPYINSNLYYDDVILLSYPAQQQILIPKQNAQEIIDQLIEESLLQRDISTEQIIDDLENRQKQEIAYEKKVILNENQILKNYFITSIPKLFLEFIGVASIV